MRKKIVSLLVILLFTTPLFGSDNNCPLENAKYRSLKESISILQQNVDLDPGCEAQSDLLKDATTQLSDVIEGNEDNSAVDIATEADLATTKTKTAINSITSINNVLRGKCGRKLMTSLDYLEALSDTVIGLGPLMLLQDGTTSLVLYTTVIGQVIKSLIDFFRGKKIDMSKLETREKFIKNSCSFYELNDKIRTLLYTLNINIETINQRLKAKKSELEKLKNSLPEKPNRGILQLETKLQKQQQEIVRLEKLAQNFHSENFLCVTVKRSIQKGFGRDVVDTLEASLDNSENAQDLRQFAKFFLENINTTDYITGTTSSKAGCSQRATEWITTIKDLQTATLTQIKQQKRILNDDQQYQEYLQAKQKIAHVEQEIKKLTEQKKSLLELKGEGANVDLSEILDNRDHIRDALFKNSSWRTKSAAHSWLEYKIEQSFKNIKLFQERYNYLLRHRKENDHQLICSLAESTWDSWNTALAHLKAGQTYCQVFKKVIDQHNYKKTFDYCYRRIKKRNCNEVDSDLSDLSNLNCSQHKSINSVMAQADYIKKYQRQFNYVRDLLEQQECQKPEFYTP